MIDDIGKIKKSPQQSFILSQTHTNRAEINLITYSTQLHILYPMTRNFTARFTQPHI